MLYAGQRTFGATRRAWAGPAGFLNGFSRQCVTRLEGIACTGLASRGEQAVHKSTLVRVGAVAAILAGLLRAAAAITPGTGSEVERQSLYFIVDLLLLLAVIAA